MKIKSVFFILSIVAGNWLSAQPIGRLGFAYYDSIPVIKNGEPLQMPWVGGLNNPQVSKIDLNYDGEEDLFIFDRSTHQVYTFIYDASAGSTPYKFAPEYKNDFPQMQHWVLLRDFNCDGKKDIFTYTVGGFKVYENMGNATNDTLYFELYNSGNPISTDQNGNMININILATDIPAITDIDGDGDLDIINFPGTSSSVQYNRNMSMETYGNCDSLLFEIKNECWGRFSEDGNSSTINLYDTLTAPCDGSTVTNPQIGLSNDVNRGSGARHVGSTLTAFDEDGNGVMDLLIGDVDGDYLTLLTNGGTQVNTNSAMVAIDTDFPSYDQSISLNMFPAAYYEDINNDGKRDLIVAPNMVPNYSTVEDAFDRSSVWYYENTNTDNNPQFSFQTEGFLQEEMIDIGRGAYPTIHDVDGDGLKDLIVGHFNTSYPDISNKITGLTYYKNTGTVNNPQFTFVTQNFASIQSYNLGQEIVPAFVDVDGDGDDDLVIGNFDGDLIWLEKTTGIMFNPPQPLNDVNGNPISVFQSAHPCFVDLDRDGKKDLVIGKSDGKLTYYSNSATNNGLELNFESSLFGGVDVTAPFFAIGQSAPFFLDLDGSYYLFVGSRMGQIFYYDNIDNNLGGNFTLQDSSFNNIYEGFRTSLWMEDIDDNGTLEMFQGSFRGGLMLYQESDSIFLSDQSFEWDEEEEIFDLFPNPNNGTFRVVFDKSLNFNEARYKIIDISGKVVQNGAIREKNNIIVIDNVKSGMYFFVLEDNEKAVAQRKLLIHGHP